MYHLNQDKCKDLTSAWQASELRERLCHFDEYQWLDILKAKINPDSSTFSQWKNDIRSAVQKESLVSKEEHSEVVDITSSGAPIIKYYAICVYHQSETVYNWMKSVSQGSGYLSQSQPDFKERTSKESSSPLSGCVLASTKILTADRAWKPIMELTENDLILNAEGSKSICSGEIVQNSHVRLLYSINDDEPFLSLDHLILTASGYKCADPRTALELNPRLKIAQLKIGDVVIKYDGSKKVMVPVDKINFASNNTALCADLHIADGLKSYITDRGYICYANYPEITASSVIRQHTRFPEEFAQFLQDNQVSLERSFGHHAYSYLSQLAGKPEHEPVQSLSHQPDHITIASMDYPCFEIFADTPTGFDTMRIIRGFAFFGENPHPVALHIRDGEVFWKTPDTSGYLKLYHYGLLGRGYVMRQGRKMEFSAGASTEYQMRYLDKTSGKKIDFGSFIMGYQQKVQSDGSKILVPVGQWKMKYETEPGVFQEGVVASTDNMSNPVTYSIQKDTFQLCACATFPDGLAQMQYAALADSGCTGANLVFSTLFESVSGEGTILDDTQKEVKLGDITGTLAPTQEESTREFVALLTEHLKNTGTANVLLSSQECEALANGYTKTVEDLARLPVPSEMSEIHQQCFYRTLHMAVYAAYEKDDPAKDRLGIPKPIVDDRTGDLTEEQARLAKQYMDFLVDHFISAYLSYVYIKEGKSPDCDPTLKDMLKPLLNISDSFNKVYYYMNGNGKNCMPSQQAYSEITNAVYHSVYRNNVVGLDEFYFDNRESWAKQLYERLTQPETLVGLINLQLVQPDNPQLSHYYSMLDVLDSSKRLPLVQGNAEETEKYSYATVLRKQVMDGALKSLLGKVKLPAASDQQAVQTFEAIITEFFKKYIKAIADGSFASWDESTKTAMQDELKEMAKEFGFASIEALVSGITQVVADIVGEILAMNDPNLSVRLVRLFKKHPRICGVLSTAFYLCGFAVIAMGFNQLSQMTPVEKTEFAISIADIGMSAIKDLTALNATRILKKGFGDLVQAENDILKGLTKSDFVEKMATAKDIPELLRNLGIHSATEASKSAKFWFQFARISEKLAKGLMLLTVAVSLGVDGYQLYEDIKNGEEPGVIALDSLMILADAVFLITEIASMVLETVCAVIPIVGIVAAAVGIILAFVSMFVKRKPPKSPLQTFVETHLVPFVTPLISPPADWLNRHPAQDKENQLIGGWLDLTAFA